MASSIQTLPTEVVQLIAAGEVIDSLAAAVRELIENALDAGATRITVSLWSEQWRVRVVDNGCGMKLADLRQAATPHSTSKIRDSADLWRINSLGFRGEALHSLTQLSDLEVCSRWAEAIDGWWVSYGRQGEAVQVEPAAIAPGTVVSVTNLFGNWSARRQGLPPLPQQMRAVQNTIQQMALCHPHVTWQVEQNDREWFAIWSGDTAQILPQLLREVQPSDLRELAVEVSVGNSPGERLRQQLGQGNRGDGGQGTGNREPASYHSSITSKSQVSLGELRSGIPQAIQDISHTQNSKSSIYLLLGLPDRCHRHRPDWVRVAINGRMVRVPELEQTILGKFRRTLPRDRYPVCFLHLRVPPDQIDWNRHPAKAEIYLHHMDDWQTQVSSAIEQALHLDANPVYSERVGQLLKTAEAQGAYQTSRSIQPSSSNSEAGVEAETEAIPHSTCHPHFLADLRAIAQVHNMYILAEHPTGMWLVEQHIAHERVLYEQLCDRWQLVSLEPPVILGQLSPAQLEQLQRLELEVESFGEQLWAVRTAPEPLARREDCADALLELSRGGDLQSALVATACRTAIRNGTSLTLQEMQTLLNQWQQTRHPHTCPHGRPIYLSLEESSLSRFFRRHWVIGKSHGI